LPEASIISMICWHGSVNGPVGSLAGSAPGKQRGRFRVPSAPLGSVAERRRQVAPGFPARKSAQRDLGIAWCPKEPGKVPTRTRRHGSADFTGLAARRAAAVSAALFFLVLVLLCGLDTRSASLLVRTRSSGVGCSTSVVLECGAGHME
jgi:hypothetical protein